MQYLTTRERYPGLFTVFMLLCCVHSPLREKNKHHSVRTEKKIKIKLSDTGTYVQHARFNLWRNLAATEL